MGRVELLGLLLLVALGARLRPAPAHLAVDGIWLGMSRKEVESKWGRPTSGNLSVHKHYNYTSFQGVGWSWTFGNHPENSQPILPGSGVAYGVAAKHHLPYVFYDSAQRVVWVAGENLRRRQDELSAGQLFLNSQARYWQRVRPKRRPPVILPGIEEGSARPGYCKDGPVEFIQSDGVSVMGGATGFLGENCAVVAIGSDAAAKAIRTFRAPPVRPGSDEPWPKFEMPGIFIDRAKMREAGQVFTVCQVSLDRNNETSARAENP